MKSVQQGPNTLTFFNVLPGGPRYGIHYLADSNIDWGQHLKLLKVWMDEKGISHVKLAYFGTADPACYRLNATYLPGTPELNGVAIRKPVLPGYVALSVNMLSGQYLRPEWRMFYRAFRDVFPSPTSGIRFESTGWTPGRKRLPISSSRRIGLSISRPFAPSRVA